MELEDPIQIKIDTAASCSFDVVGYHILEFSIRKSYFIPATYRHRDIPWNRNS